MGVSALITVQSGSSAAQALTAAAPVATVVPGDTVTVSLTTTTGVSLWTCFQTNTSGVGSYPAPLFPNVTRDSATGVTPFSFTFVAPLGGSFAISIQSEASDGISNSAISYFTIQSAAGAPVGMTHLARAVITSALNAYTASGSGTLTANAVGTFASSKSDGVVIAVGDRVLLPDGIANAAKDAGLYQVVQLGAAGAKMILQRVAEFPTGGLMRAGTIVDLGPDGTQWGLSTWKNIVTGDVTIDTTSMQWMPKTGITSVTLAAGVSAAAITAIPVLSATRTAFKFNASTQTPGANANTAYFKVTTLTPGALGTATFNLQATTIANALNNTDVSVVTIEVTNW